MLANDQVIAIPTETVYGLAGIALSISAVTKIYEIKTRHWEETKKHYLKWLMLQKSFVNQLKNRLLLNKYEKIKCIRLSRTSFSGSHAKRKAPTDCRGY
ncbi:MAG: Sua5/YciO/YrdC/YwlC family protein [Bacteroidota bacterium]|nr:Sua5/YciO/YrdC/YwlC family protein [Bacteroidota bacterium]